MADYILDKGFPVLSTYNTSAAAGVTAFRCVKLAVSNGQTVIDINGTSTAGTISFVVQENIDAAKVATGKAVADVRLIGVTKVYVAVGTTVTIGSRVMAGGSGGTLGGVVTATGATAQVLGIVVGMSVPGGTVAAGDLIDVMLTPGVQFGA